VLLMAVTLLLTLTSLVPAARTPVSSVDFLVSVDCFLASPVDVREAMLVTDMVDVLAHDELR